VRTHGPVDDLPGADTSDHVCWIYAEDDDFDEAAREFLAGGLARGERLLCVGDRVIDRLRAMTPPVDDLDGLVQRGAVETLSVADAYEAAGPFGPEEQLAYYDAATRRALADGYRGLRVIAEISDLAADPERRDELVRWEQLADRYAVQGAGFSAMCAYRADVPPDALADLASVHPLVRAPAELSSFRLFVDGERLALAGTVDAISSYRLARVLSSAPVSDDGAVLDLTALEFLDVAACRALARWALDLSVRSVPLRVTGSSALQRRMWRILELDQLVPVTFAEASA
jgi:hypothetical protein